MQKRGNFDSMMRSCDTISFSGLSEQYRSLSTEIDGAIRRVMKSAWYILGKEVDSFENAFASYCGTTYAIGCASGTDAIALSLMALNIGKGDEVITVPNTAMPTVSAISMAGATPVFVDIDDYYLMDTKKIKRSITKKTKAILPVHLYGQMADMDKIMALAKQYNLKVVEDACQSHGAKYKGLKAGSVGDAGCFSFYPTKNLGCFGDGGAITTNCAKLYEKLLMMRNYGQRDRYLYSIKGINSRLDELQAAVLRVKLAYLDRWNKQRRKIAHLYNKLLGDVCTVPMQKEGSYHVFHLYVIRVRDRKALQSYLKENGVDTLIHYPLPIHLQKAYMDLGYKRGDFCCAERSADEIISLPIHPYLSSNSVKHICMKIKSIAGRRGIVRG